MAEGSFWNQKVDIIFMCRSLKHAYKLPQPQRFVHVVPRPIRATCRYQGDGSQRSALNDMRRKGIFEMMQINLNTFATYGKTNKPADQRSRRPHVSVVECSCRWLRWWPQMVIQQHDNDKQCIMLYYMCDLVDDMFWSLLLFFKFVRIYFVLLAVRSTYI